MFTLQALLEISSRQHSHLCPRQILGVRIGVAGTAALGLDLHPTGKRMLVILESDGCFADGISAATNCTVGHRTLRVEDYGKVAATFVDVKSELAVRVAPHVDVRQRAQAWVPEEAQHYFAQMQAYQSMPDNELLTVTEVQLLRSVREIVSRPGMRVTCSMCGEEIMNEREVHCAGQVLCQSCAGQSYYQAPVSVSVSSLHRFIEQNSKS